MPLELPRCVRLAERADHREESREPACMFLQQLDAEQLGIATGRAGNRYLLWHDI